MNSISTFLIEQHSNKRSWILLEYDAIVQLEACWWLKYDC